MNRTYQFLLRWSIHVNSYCSGYLRHTSENSDYYGLIKSACACDCVYACECATVFFAETNLFYLAIGVIHKSFLCIHSVFLKN